MGNKCIPWFILELPKPHNTFLCVHRETATCTTKLRIFPSFCLCHPPQVIKSQNFFIFFSGFTTEKLALNHASNAPHDSWFFCILLAHLPVGLPNHLFELHCLNLCFSISSEHFSFLPIVQSLTSLHFPQQLTQQPTSAVIWEHHKPDPTVLVWRHAASIIPILPQDDFEMLFRLQCFPGMLSFHFRKISITSSPSLTEVPVKWRNDARLSTTVPQVPAIHRSSYFKWKPLRRR